MSDKVRKTFSLDAQNADYLDRETNNKSGFINDLIEAHRQGASEVETAVARHREEQLQSELRQVKSRENSIKSQLETVQKRLSTEEERREEKMEEARNALETVPMEVDNPAVENWARKLKMTPAELIEEVEDAE